MDLLSSFGKQGVQLGLLNRKVDIEDTEYLSKYFVLNEFDPLFTGGKNSVSFNGSVLLKEKSEIQIECLDSKGNSLYIEFAKSLESQYSDVAKFVVSIHVYDETYNGPGKLIIVGTSRKGEIVRWIGNITIDKTLTNTSKVRFYYKPTLEARPLLFPVVDTGRAAIDYPPPPEARKAVAISQVQSYVGNITVTNGGTGYSSATVSITGGGGSGASAIPVISGGQIASITVINSGANYTSAPTVTISGNGTGATAITTLTRPVSALILVDGGAGYTFVPTVTFLGTGTGATATATVVDGAVTSLILTSGGNGYITAPAVEFDLPPAPPAPELNRLVSFTSSFYTFAASPAKDTNKNAINLKQTNIDYRLVLTDIDTSLLESSTFPTGAFNKQMEGLELTLYINKIQLPFSTLEQNTNITSSHVIKKVIDSKTVQLVDPFYYAVGKNQFISQILNGKCMLDYRFVLYNTNPDSNQRLEIAPEEYIDVKDSYAEVTYRNIRPFSGRVARHKLYRKGSFTPGDFQLISDELLPSIELLSDPVTFNKFYDKLGTFYHQPHIDKYWWPTSTLITLDAQSSPINAMRIASDSIFQMDGTIGVMAKVDTAGIDNDNIYRPYDDNEYANLSGQSYNSNFISLKKDSLYQLSFDVIMEKDIVTPSSISFYFTSSISSIQTEPQYNSNFGLKLGEIVVTDKTNVKYFDKTQIIYFTPTNDYFGTLVLVPYFCNVIISNLSLKTYGDHGFSPDVLTIRVPFPIQIANEAYDLKAELLDLDSNVIYSNLKTVQTFDANGESLYSISQANSLNSVIQVTPSTTVSNTSVTFVGSPLFPDLQNCNDSIRLVGWHVPDGDATTDGKLCYMNVASLYIDNDNYIAMSEYQSGIEHNAKSIAIRYDFSLNEGRKIVIDLNGNKEQFP